MNKKNFIHRFTYRITSLYLILGFLWIYLSDRFIGFIFQDPQLLSQIQTYKGVFYVLLTGILLFFLVRKHISNQNQTNQELRAKIEAYKALHDQFQQQNSDLKVARDNALKNEKFLSAIIENIPNLVYVKDYRDGSYLKINNAVEAFFGKSHSDIIGKTDLDLFSKEMAEYFMRIDSEVLKSGRTMHFEECANGKNGEILLLTTKIPVQDENGSFRFLLGVSQDITLKKQAEKELIASKEKAEESDRLKTAFLQNISHEIRTPMNAIYGFSGLLLEPELSNEQKASYSYIIQNNCEKLLHIITDVLTVSALETRQLFLHNEAVHLKSLMDELYDMFKSNAEAKDLKFSMHNTAECDLTFQADKLKLQEVLSNLLSNAIKFTSKGSIDVSCHLEGETVCFKVKDTGIGFDESQKQHIFEHFRQAIDEKMPLYGGTGLGLAICRGLIELLHGTIQVESTPGSGSVFTIFIPMGETFDSPKSKSANQQIVSEINSKTILIAEDEDMNYLFLETLLEPMKLHLIRAKNGQEAVDLVQSDPTIALILMDIRMPIKNGQQAAMEIKLLRPDLPIIAQTAYALDFEIEKFKKVFDGYLTKPLRAQVLKQKIQNFISC